MLGQLGIENISFLYRELKPSFTELLGVCHAKVPNDVACDDTRD